MATSKDGVAKSGERKIRIDYCASWYYQGFYGILENHHK